MPSNSDQPTDDDTEHTSTDVYRNGIHNNPYTTIVTRNYDDCGIAVWDCESGLTIMEFDDTASAYSQVHLFTNEARTALIDTLQTLDTDTITTGPTTDDPATL